jgi:hypothetical protein
MLPLALSNYKTTLERNHERALYISSLVTLCPYPSLKNAWTSNPSDSAFTFASFVHRTGTNGSDSPASMSKTFLLFTPVVSSLSSLVLDVVSFPTFISSGFLGKYPLKLKHPTKFFGFWSPEHINDTAIAAPCENPLKITSRGYSFSTNRFNRSNESLIPSHENDRFSNSAWFSSSKSSYSANMLS